MNRKIIKRKIKFIIEPIYNYFKKTNHRRTTQYTRFYEDLDVINNTVLYESRDGKSLTDSPYAIFKYLLSNPEYKDYKHIWSVDSFEDLDSVISQYKDRENVTFVKRNSEEYLKSLATSKYLINNSTFQSFFIPKKEQVYINTWHGTPLKNMGFDIPGNPAHSQNVVRNFLSADYLLSPNEHTTDMFIDSYKLDGLYSGEIIEEGYPRIDLTYHTDASAFQSQLSRLDLNIDQQKQTILYAPTWKGKNVSSAKNDMYQIIADMNYLKQQVGKEYNILIKVHPFLYGQARKFTEVKDILIPDFVDTNELLSTVDILITDYSSIFFDYLVTNKPILFYVWDYDDYNQQRGRYLSDEELPGPTLFTIQGVAQTIQNIGQTSDKYKDVYKQNQKRFTNHDDGNVTKRIVEYIFMKKNTPLKVIKNLDTKKKKILIYPGGMANNGITSSFINLMDNIDFDQYDVSIFTKSPNSKEVLNNISKVNKKARFLFRHGLPDYGLFEKYRDKLVHNRGAHTSLTKKAYPEEAYRREFKRYFGRSNFDYAIDFSGYSLFWAKYILVSDAKKKICYMHNDILSDSERTINGKRPHRINLRGLFSVYNQFDKLVSVSVGTMELNKKNLIEYADESKFDFIMNSINPQKILTLSNEGNEDQHDQASENLEDDDTLESNVTFKGRAIINNPKDHFIWNRPPMLKGAQKMDPAGNFVNQEVNIIREARTDTNVYYKFTFGDRIVGWMDQECFELLPDSIITENKVNKTAIIKHVRRNHIWNQPYMTEGIEKVSASKDYKGILVDVDLEARTQHGFYSRFSINGVVIGWIDSSALANVTEYDMNDSSSSERSFRKWSNHRNYKEFIEQLENRTLEEKSLNSLATISNPADFVVWNKPYPNVGYKKVMDASELSGAIAFVTKSNRTAKGTFYQFSIDGKQIGWLDVNAFTLIDKPVVISETAVKYVAEIKRSSEDVVLTSVENREEVKDFQQYDGKTVTVDIEAKSQDGVYCHFIYEDESIGWIKKRALHVKETLGIKTARGFIPEPTKENYNFINMGRLSPEKAQDNLIKAFSEFHKGFKNAKLYILGEGPLRNDLEKLIDQLQLEDSVYLVGQLDNPFKLMKKCDCFVLSSHYEGQPMVLLEAMTLGMKIIATDIVANRTVLEQGRYGLLVENSVEGLANGLEQLAKNELKVLPDPFFPEEYNKKAMDTFYKVFE
ncbi:CDP-glycerol glycerophosphotransferase family protein [Bacillus salipaludis]|uniref:CDP-glycerol glycerophosphotransferase family protein n=1 Tax=Bacillus salipaludis TaxID=2547811 RepID=A0AA90R1S1_9BACI|nr:CDP-glycerol glycerophosphotransferase family protein [Bacillus salipaludis]MDQ6600369.1 CDP-glycerol glycerophosphotransferase family protein [Bacillus salipaludis]